MGRVRKDFAFAATENMPACFDLRDLNASLDGDGLLTVNLPFTKLGWDLDGIRSCIGNDARADEYIDVMADYAVGLQFATFFAKRRV
jgi:hypothetical protein